MNEGVQLTTERHGDALIARVTGEINFTTSPELRVHLTSALEHKPDRLIVDLAGVPYMDSSGVATLVEALQMQSRHGHKLVLCNLQQRVQSIFEISRLTSVFKIASDEQSAATL